MEKEEIRAVIKYLNLKGLSAADIKKDMDDVLGNSSPSRTTIYDWINEFKRGRTNTKQAQGAGRPKTALSDENCLKVQRIVLADRRIKIREIAETLHLSYGSIFNILHEDLGMKKLSARWVPRLLTPMQKMNRVVTSEACLGLMEQYPEFFKQLVTVDETWLHYYTPETKLQSMQWMGPGEKPPKKAKTVPSAGKVMATVFWDHKGILLVDYLEKGRTINGPYYANLLDQLKQAILDKRPHLQKKKIFLLQDNAPVHNSVVSMSKIHELNYELVPHPPYSPDLAPSDYFLFPNLKKHLAGQKYKFNSEVISAAEAYFDDLQESDYCSGIMTLQNRWNKCINLQGDYVEK